MTKRIATLLALMLATTVLAAEADEMKAFPPAEKGMVRYVLQVPSQDDESAYRVELVVGKTVRTDPTNRYFFTGDIAAETIKGWGYTRYRVSTLGPMAGTLMAVDPDLPKVDRFVPLGGEPYLIRYNSRLPLVVYVPEGAEVMYRIWKAPPGMTPMEKG